MKTRLTIHEDYPVAVSSVMVGHNIDCLAFNQDYILIRKPELVLEIMELYRKATETIDMKPLSMDDPRFLKAIDKLNDWKDKHEYPM